MSDESSVAPPLTAFVSSGYRSRPPRPIQIAANTLFRLVGFSIDALVTVPLALLSVFVFLSWVGHSNDFMDGELGFVGVVVRVGALIVLLSSALFFAAAYRLVAHATAGRSVGEKVMGVQCLSVSGEKPTWSMSAKRAIIPFALATYGAALTAPAPDFLSPSPSALVALIDLPWILTLLVALGMLALVVAPVAVLLAANYKGVRERADRRTLMDRMSGTIVVATAAEAEV